MTSLPTEWQMVSLRRITQEIERGDPATLYHATFNYIDIASVDNEAKTISTDISRESRDAPSRARQLVQAGDVVVSTVRPRLNAVALIPANLENVVASTGFCVLRPKNEILLSDYLFLFCTSPAFINQLAARERGASYPAVTDEDVLGTKIPLPPLSEQRRIVEILNEARDIRHLRQQADDLTTKLIPAIFNKMFGDPLSNNRNWPVARLPKLGTLDRGRSRHRPRDEPSLYGGPYPFIQTGDIASSKGWITDFSQTYSEAGLAQSRLWPAGTMCITIAANIGATAILSFDACFPDSVVGFTPNEDVVVEYVKWTFDVLRARNEARAHAGAQKNINLKFLNSLQIGLPPKDLQIEFRRRVQAIREIHKAHSEDSAKGLQSLTSSLLANAFSGELSADWRNKNQEQLSHEAVERDQWLRDNGVKLANTDQRIEDRLNDTSELLAELNREQRKLLEHIRKLEPKENGGTFTLSSLVSRLDEPLEQLPVDAIRRHLDVLATCGLIKAISRQSGDGVSSSIAFGNVYREPRRESPTVSASDDPDFLKLSELDRLLRQATEQYEIDQLRAGNLAPRSGTYQELGQSGELGKTVVMEAGKSLPPPTLVGGVYRWKEGD